VVEEEEVRKRARRKGGSCLNVKIFSIALVSFVIRISQGVFFYIRLRFVHSFIGGVHRGFLASRRFFFFFRSKSHLCLDYDGGRRRVRSVLEANSGGEAGVEEVIAGDGRLVEQLIQ